MHDQQSFLQLLIEEAPPEAFEAQVKAARDDGLPPAALDAVREAAVVALQVRAVLRERRRREVELAALYETAGDLIAIRDVQRVLQAIVGRARRLLDADTAYITLIDREAQEICMRVTDGMVTEEFKRLRLPIGVGLGGLVAERATPYFTPDYAKDPRFVHTSEIDRVVTGEALNAILGVPMKLGDEVIGVLFASNRQARPFSPDEVNLLGSLAAHAAIALENARLFTEAREALAQVSTANAAIRAHSEAIERAAAVHERLTEVVLRGGTLDEVAAAVAEVFGGDLWVLDHDGRLVSRAGQGAVVLGAADLESAAQLSRESGRISRSGTDIPAWVTPVVAGSEHLGSLVLAGQPDLGGADTRTLERAAQVTALVLLNERAATDAQLRVQADFVEDLLNRPQRHPEGIRRRARLFGVDLDADHVVIVAAAPEVERRRFLAAVAALVTERGGLAGERAATAVLLLPGSDVADGVDLVRHRLPEMLGAAVTAGVAGPAGGAAGLLQAYEQADRCRRTLLALGRTGETATTDDLGLYALLLSEAGRGGLEGFVDRTLGPLVAYDRDRNTDLTHTLEAYFQHGGNATRTAAALHVHVNTLYQRFERIGSLLGSDWQDAERSLHLHFACRLRQLQRTV
ncbi:MAG TPA: GAF domain-containing protein [Euzebya sp.]|nr:GAF domain-containing protein [Euzebya sp.]